MARPKSPKRPRKYNERECVCDKCHKKCNSTPDKKHRRCGGTWR